MMKHAMAALCLAGCLSACGGGGGGGPTAPASVPQLAGSWMGAWTVGDPPFAIVLHPGLQLTQNGSSLQGGFTISGGTFPVTGTVGADLRMTWAASGGGCGTLTGNGTANGLSATQIVGTINLDTTGCENPGQTTGPVVWTRISAAKGPLRSAGRPETFARLLDAIRGRSGS